MNPPTRPASVSSVGGPRSLRKAIVQEPAQVVLLAAERRFGRRSYFVNLFSNGMSDTDHPHRALVDMPYPQSSLLAKRSSLIIEGEHMSREPAETRILIVNDMADQLEIMRILLRRAGYSVSTACDGKEGFEVAQTAHPDLIISDVTMPGLDGSEMCRLIRRHPELRTIPILLVSAQRKDSASVAAGLSAGADDYLEAPYDPARLIMKAAQLIERQRAEAALRESEAQYRELVENINDVIFAVDENGLLTYFSPVIESIAGYNPSEVIGRSFTEFIYPEDLPAVLNNFGRVLAQQPEPLEYRIQTKPGKIVWVRTSSRPIIVGGKAVGLRGMMTDISGRKHVEAALRASEAELRALFGAITDVILLLSAEGRYLKIAPTDPSYLYRPPAELVGKKLHDVFPKDEADFFLEHIRRALNEGHGHRVEYKMQLGDTEVWFDGGVSPMSNDTVVWIARDITEHRSLEEQLRQSQKLEAIGQLAGGIAHDFNNLLTAINGYSDLTIKQLKREDPLRRNVEEIRKAGECAASLTRQLLAFSRKQVLQPQVLEINSLITNTSRMLRRLVGEHIEFITLLRPEAGRINADPGQIEQVIMNLVVNARDAMPHGGKLIVETNRVYVDDEYVAHHVGVNAGPYVSLSVSDTGTGMDDETQARIFVPFFTTKGPGKGTGLGLSTVYGIVKQSGGNISVYSELAKGTTFKILLPRVVEETREHRRPTELESSLRGTETILLVEDDDRVRKLVHEVLESYGYQVLEAAKGLEAIAISESYNRPIHLLLTDVVMPGMSGRAVVDRLVELRPEIKVLFTSGYTDDAIGYHGVLDANTLFIQKPFMPSALARKVRDVLDDAGSGRVRKE